MRRSHGSLSEVADFSDETLLRLVVLRRTDAFAELYRRHALAVTAMSARLAPDRSTADDLTQSAFLALWSRAPRVELRAGSLRPWLMTVARNAAIDRARATRPVAHLDERHDALPDARNTEDVVMRNEAQRDIQRALALLDENQRTVIELAYFGELSQSEIAAVTGLPLGTVKGRVRLAMQHLRRALATPIGELT